MKKILLSLLCLISFMAINAETKTLTFATSDFAGDSEKYVETETTSTVSDVTFAYNNFNPKTGQIRGNKDKVSQNFYFYNTTPINGTITSIKIKTDAGLKNNFIYVTTGNAKLGTCTNGTKVGNSSIATSTVTYNTTDGGSFFEIYFKKGATYNTVKLSSIEITYESASGEEPGEGGGEEPGEGGGEEPGEGGGEEPGDDPVEPETPETATVVTFDFTDPSSLKPVQETPEFGQDKSITVNDVVFTAGNVSLSFDKGSAGTDCRIWAGKSAYDLRTYKNSTMTFTVTGAAITSIVFTGSEVGSSKMTSEEGTFEGETWKGDSQSITFTAKATTKINTITVTYDTATGIEDTMVDENSPVEYYNLQGVKVANPENGIFIKKQGAKATKVIL